MQKIAPSSGFYTSGEFLRTGKYLDLHNVTLVIAALREGEAHTLPEPVDEVQAQFSGKVSMINRLATFIKATTDELALKNRQLEIMAITDGLTQLYNRREIQRRITQAICEKHTPGTYLIMLDIDDFKLVNDNCGHSTGDAVLVGIAKVLQEYADIEDMSAGRWGGEEFMLLLTDADDERAKAIADGICTTIAAKDFDKAGRMTVSVGVTRAIDGEDPDRTCYRVDAALYKAKAEGKNRVIWS
jgi:diguanylate cyclase (GGDEF)-like protein